MLVNRRFLAELLQTRVLLNPRRAGRPRPRCTWSPRKSGGKLREHQGERKSEQDVGDVVYRQSILFIPVIMGGSREMRTQRSVAIMSKPATSTARACRASTGAGNSGAGPSQSAAVRA